MIPNRKLYNIENSKEFFVRILKEYKVYYKFKTYVANSKKRGLNKTGVTATLLEHFYYDNTPRCLFNAIDALSHKRSLIPFNMYLELIFGTYIASCILRHMDKYKNYHNFDTSNINIGQE